MDGQLIGKASTLVRIGNVLTFPYHDRVKILRVMGHAKRRGPAATACLLYEDLSPPAPPRDKPAPSPTYDKGGRPTKRDRRVMDAFERSRG